MINSFHFIPEFTNFNFCSYIKKKFTTAFCGINKFIKIELYIFLIEIENNFGGILKKKWPHLCGQISYIIIINDYYYQISIIIT